VPFRRQTGLSKSLIWKDALCGSLFQAKSTQPSKAPAEARGRRRSKIERDVIVRGVFTSVSDLKRKLMRYIRHYNKSPRTVKWKCADPSRHISTQSVGTGH
jgi:hypothetical protein